MHAICVVATDDFLNTANTSKQKNYVLPRRTQNTAGEPIFRQRGYVRIYIPYGMVHVRSVPLSVLLLHVRTYNTHTYEPDKKSEESQSVWYNRTLMLSHRVLAEQHS